MEEQLKRLFLDNKEHFIDDFTGSPQKYIDCLKKTSLNDVLGLILNLQNKQIFSYEFSFIFNTPAWKKAESVLDLGCGPGYLTHSLSSFFPKILFTGIDNNQEFIEKAKSYHRNQNCRFYCDDVYNLEENQYDFIIVRYFLQHIRNVEKCFAIMKKLLNDNGKIIVFEGDYSLDYYTPNMSYLKQLQESVILFQKKGGADKKIALKLEADPKKYGMRLCQNKKIAVPIITRETKELFLKIHLIRFQVFYHLYGLEIDYHRLASEFVDWIGIENSYAQEGSIHLLLCR